MAIEPSLIRTDRHRKTDDAQRGDDKLSNETRNRAFVSLNAIDGGSDVTQMTATLW